MLLSLRIVYKQYILENYEQTMYWYYSVEIIDLITLPKLKTDNEIMKFRKLHQKKWTKIFVFADHLRQKSFLFHVKEIVLSILALLMKRKIFSWVSPLSLLTPIMTKIWFSIIFYYECYQNFVIFFIKLVKSLPSWRDHRLFLKK